MAACFSEKTFVKDNFIDSKDRQRSEILSPDLIQISFGQCWVSALETADGQMGKKTAGVREGEVGERQR